MYVNRRRRWTAIALVTALASVTMTGCGEEEAASSSSTANPTETITARTNEKIRAMVPKSIRERGHINDLVQSPNAPMEYNDDSGKLIGVDIDMAHALADVMGLELKITTTNNFTQLIPSVQTHRTDFALSAVKDLPERQASVMFVDYFRTGNQFLGLKSQADKFQSLSDLCGESIVAATGTSYPDLAKEISKKECESKGKKPISVVLAVSSAEQLLQVKQGRAVANLIGLEPLALQMKREPGVWKPIGKPFNRAKYGIVVAKDNRKLARALQAAMNELIKTGTYKKILTKWGLTGGAVSRATINGAVTE